MVQTDSIKNLSIANQAQNQMELLPSYYEWTYGKFKNLLHGNVMEMGCGAGIGIPNYISNVDKIYAVDYDQKLLDQITSKFKSSKIKTINADLTGDWKNLSTIKVDAMILMDVLEHFEKDQKFLSQASELIKPGGTLALKVPSQSRLFSDIDKASGHYRRYDVKDLEMLAKKSGFEVLWIREMNPIGGIVYRWKKQKDKALSMTFTPLQLKVINRLIPILTYMDYVPYVSGLSLVAAFKKVA